MNSKLKAALVAIALSLALATLAFPAAAEEERGIRVQPFVVSNSVADGKREVGSVLPESLLTAVRYVLFNTVSAQAGGVFYAYMEGQNQLIVAETDPRTGKSTRTSDQGVKLYKIGNDTVEVTDLRHGVGDVFFKRLGTWRRRFSAGMGFGNSVRVRRVESREPAEIKYGPSSPEPVFVTPQAPPQPLRSPSPRAAAGARVPHGQGARR